MSGYLLDTNVVSEIMRDLPEPRVIAFLSEHSDLWLSSIVIHELEFGWRLLPQGRRRDYYRQAILDYVGQYQDKILPLTRAGAEWAALYRVQARRSGYTLDLGDALIAGTARVRGLSVATRNVRDFQGLDIDIVNPWEAT